ncbi:TrkA C-terminal domain-containing protein [Desulfosporosinus shakirovi]|uniref:TrkA C-terminal domain-containing protein n=1 Tax=Desulfosporosinus shakirovi TaxID=2885154 RepID=UPI001E48834B|nr:TrkA C-terminal domain-containing protein [Desulfosporosinus sp. SRJS8]
MVLAILRGDQVISKPSAGDQLSLGDLLIVLGLRDQLHRLEKLAANLSNCKT